MPEEEKVEVEEGKEPEKSEKKSSKKLLVMIGVAVLLLGGGGFAGWKFFLADKASGPDGESVQSTGTAVEDTAKSAIIYDMKPFIVNLLGNQGKRYLKAKVDIEVSSEEMVSELKERQSQLRDAILLLLAGKSFEDISNPEGKTQLRNELMVRINENLRSGTIQNLYFTEFVVQ
jgi:flagellar FliL protein